MTENIENLILEQLRAIRGDIARVERKVDDLVLRVNSLEQKVGQLHVDLVNIHGRLDHHEQRLARIERRLELREEPAP